MTKKDVQSVSLSMSKSGLGALFNPHAISHTQSSLSHCSCGAGGIHQYILKQLTVTKLWVSFDASVKHW